MQLAASRWLTPCGVVLLGFPLLFLLFPDGIPYVAADCGDPYTLGVVSTDISCTTCATEQGAIVVQDCTLTPTSNKCEYKVDATVDIGIDGCELIWCPRCEGNQCTALDRLAATGIVQDKAVSYTHACDAGGDHMVLHLGQGGPPCPGECPAFLLESSGLCPNG